MEKQEQVHARMTDPRTGGVYLVTAYRPLSREEAASAIKQFAAAQPGAIPKRGEEVTVRTIIGLRD